MSFKVGEPISQNNPLPIELAAGAEPVPTVASAFARVVSAPAIVRRANTNPYTVGQIVGGSATAGFSNNGFTFAGISRIPGGLVQLNRARLYKSQATAAGAFELVVFRGQPTITVGDAGAFATGVPLGTAAAAARIVARFNFDMTTALVGSDGAELAVAPVSTVPALVGLPQNASDLFGILRVTGAYTPASGEQISVALEGYAF